MTRSFTLLAATILAISPTAFSQDLPKKIAIIKADDVRGVAKKWSRFFEISEEKGTKVSAGIICDSLQSDKGGYFKWLNELQSSGMVEFWNHGWDHKRWENEDRKELREFSGTGYEHQKRHFEEAQKHMKAVLGIAPNTFGAPFNSTDSDTVKVMAENSDMRLFFCNQGTKLKGKILAPMNLRGEHDGTGKPNFAKFKADYKKDRVTFTAIQFHPGAFQEKHFAEYAKILDFLIAEGWTFVLPSEYITTQNTLKMK